VRNVRRGRERIGVENAQQVKIALNAFPSRYLLLKALRFTIVGDFDKALILG